MLELITSFGEYVSVSSDEDIPGIAGLFFLAICILVINIPPLYMPWKSSRKVRIARLKIAKIIDYYLKIENNNLSPSDDEKVSVNEK